MGIDLRLEDTGVEQAVKAAVLAQITDEARERLIAGAIEYLLTPGKDYRGQPTTSPLQDAVNRAVQRAADEIVASEIADREDFRRAVREQLGKAVERLIAGEWTIADAFGEAMKRAFLDR